MQSEREEEEVSRASKQRDRMWNKIRLMNKSVKNVAKSVEKENIQQI